MSWSSRTTTTTTFDRAVISSLSSRHSTRFIVPRRVGERLRGWGVAAERITELGWDEFVQVATVRFTATEARHASRRGVFDGSSTMWASWELPGVTASVFYTGDHQYVHDRVLLRFGQAFSAAPCAPAGN